MKQCYNISIPGYAPEYTDKITDATTKQYKVFLYGSTSLQYNSTLLLSRTMVYDNHFGTRYFVVTFFTCVFTKKVTESPCRKKKSWNFCITVLPKCWQKHNIVTFQSHALECMCNHFSQNRTTLCVYENNCAETLKQIIDWLWPD